MNVIEHAMIPSSGPTLEAQLLKVAAEKETSHPRNLRELQREHILDALERTGRRFMGTGGAAETLGLKRTGLYGRMKKVGLDRLGR